MGIKPHKDIVDGRIHQCQEAHDVQQIESMLPISYSHGMKDRTLSGQGKSKSQNTKKENQQATKHCGCWFTSLLHLLGPTGFEPVTNRLCVPLRLSPPLTGSWSGLSLHPLLGFFRSQSRGCPPTSLYTFPHQLRAWFGITTANRT